VDTAVAQLAVVQVGLFGPFTSQLGDTRDRLALLFRVEYLLEQDVRSLQVLVQVVVKLPFDKVADELLYRGTVGPHIFRTQFCLGLALEDGLFYLDADSGHNTRADIRIFEILVVILFDDATDRLLESREMRTALCGELAIHE